MSYNLEMITTRWQPTWQWGPWLTLSQSFEARVVKCLCQLMRCVLLIFPTFNLFSLVQF